MTRISVLRRLVIGFLACALVGTILLAQDQGGELKRQTGSSDPTLKRSVSPQPVDPSVPGTRVGISPEVSGLLKDLQAKEAVAAAEAESIRQLRANGNARWNQSALTEHERKLQQSLGEAFDLKNKLDEDQMKELRSRLNELRRQVFLRRQYRNKIIQRRATELLQGSVIGWDPPGIIATRPPETVFGPSEPPPTPVDSNDVDQQNHPEESKRQDAVNRPSDVLKSPSP